MNKNVIFWGNRCLWVLISHTCPPGLLDHEALPPSSQILTMAKWTETNGSQSCTLQILSYRCLNSVFFTGAHHCAAFHIQKLEVSKDDVVESSLCLWLFPVAEIGRGSFIELDVIRGKVRTPTYLCVKVYLVGLGFSSKGLMLVWVG